MPSSPPKVARPTIVTLTGSGVRRVVVSPIFRSPFSAAPRLTTTSPDLDGARPSASWYELSFGSSIQLPARVGGPWPPMGLPLRRRAGRRPGCRARRPRHRVPSRPAVTRPVSTGCRTPWLSPGVVIVPALRTTASVPLVALPNIVSKLARSVSPMTRVPARKATPRSTARNVPAKRRLWARRDETLMRTEAFMPAALPCCRRPSYGPGPCRPSGLPSGRRAGRRRGRRPRRRVRRRPGRG